MKRNRSLSKLRSYLLPAFAAIVLSLGTVGCSTTSDGESSPAVDGIAAGEESQNENGPGNSENGDSAAMDGVGNNINVGSNDIDRADGESISSNNQLGNELNNAMGGDPNAGGLQGYEAGGDSGGEVAAPTETVGEPGEGEAPVDGAAADPFAAGAAPFPAAGNVPTEAPSTDQVTNSDVTSPVAGEPTLPGDGAIAEPTEEETNAPATVSGPSSLPEMGAKLAYYVMRGDTLGGIAQKIYGSRARWKALQSENGLIDANKIYPGDVVYYTLNEASRAFAEKYERGNRNSYTVMKGDTLSRIAAKFYGSQGAWRALWKENPQVTNPDRIRIGMVLTYRTEIGVALKDDEDGELEAPNNGPAMSDDADVSDVFTASAE